MCLWNSFDFWEFLFDSKANENMMNQLSDTLKVIDGSPKDIIPSHGKLAVESLSAECTRPSPAKEQICVSDRLRVGFRE